MLDFHLDQTAGILRIEPKAALTAADFKAVAGQVDAYLATHPRLNGLMLSAEHFPGWDSFAALMEHLRFIREHQKRIARIAVLTDNALLKILPQIAAHFVAPEIREFALGEQDQALAWLRSAEG